MKYCNQCGHPVKLIIPDGDNRKRHVCVNCETIHYQNPNIVAGTIPIYGDKVLLCKRAIEPRYGYWTLPAGFMENQESTIEAALRETREEAEADVSIERLFTVLSVPQIDQVHLFFLATLTEEKFGAGRESLETRLFDEKDIPWSEIAFPTVKKTLQYYFKERSSGSSDFKARVEDIRRSTSRK
ncbi:MAG: NUDIX hydrolase [Proteobacteria bacterium]|nr:MAG: NUDIX hydrolase [Pseudomonadota bacterium]